MSVWPAPSLQWDWRKRRRSAGAMLLVLGGGAEIHVDAFAAKAAVRFASRFILNLATAIRRSPISVCSDFITRLPRKALCGRSPARPIRVQVAPSCALLGLGFGAPAVPIVVYTDQK